MQAFSGESCKGMIWHNRNFLFHCSGNRSVLQNNSFVRKCQILVINQYIIKIIIVIMFPPSSAPRSFWISLSPGRNNYKAVGLVNERGLCESIVHRQIVYGRYKRFVSIRIIMTVSSQSLSLWSVMRYNLRGYVASRRHDAFAKDTHHGV